jgi:hypothetical protein
MRTPAKQAKSEKAQADEHQGSSIRMKHDIGVNQVAQKVLRMALEGIRDAEKEAKGRNHLPLLSQFPIHLIFAIIRRYRHELDA